MLFEHGLNGLSNLLKHNFLLQKLLICQGVECMTNLVILRHLPPESLRFHCNWPNHLERKRPSSIGEEFATFVATSPIDLLGSMAMTVYRGRWTVQHAEHNHRCILHFCDRKFNQLNIVWFLGYIEIQMDGI